MADCPNCEYHRKRAQLWRDEAYKQAGHPLPEREQEPVAWGVFEGNLHDMFFSQKEAQEMADLKGTHAEVRPLYATPQRTWVGLTDKEIEAIWKVAMFTDYGIGAELSNQPFVHYARAIEAKLKEKNT
jgi:hypothetical protein